MLKFARKERSRKDAKNAKNRYVFLCVFARLRETPYQVITK